MLGILGIAPFEGLFGMCCIRYLTQIAFLLVCAFAQLPLQVFAAQILLVASYRSDDVRKYDAQSGAPLGVLVQSGTAGLSLPAELLIGPGNDLFVSSIGRGKVFRFNGQSGAFVQEYILPSSNTPRGIAFGADGRLYVANATAQKIERFDVDSGAYLGAFAMASGSPIGISFGPDGILYAAIASSTQTAKNGHTERFNPLTGASLGAFGPTNIDNPQALVFGPDQNLYLHSQYDYKILKLNGVTGQLLSTFVSESYPFNPSSGIVFGPDGNLYTGNLTAGAPNDGVRRYNGATGGFIDNFVPGSGNYWSTGLAFAAVPEPRTFVLLAIGILGMVLYRVRCQ